MNTPTDEQLLANYLEGQVSGFELLVQRYSRELFNFLARFTGNGPTAEDIVQETFLQIHLSAGSFDQRRRFKPWLFTIAANKARDFLRSRSRKPEVPLHASVGSEDEEGQQFLDFLSDAASSPLEVLEKKQEQEFVRSIVDQMPVNLKEILILCYYHRFAYKEIADILGIPLGTVKSRLHSAVAYFGRTYRATLKEQV
ncbi:MAG: sigma-70 family RNA polymerase sigma factor [Planctomycetota bacterium]|nr:MAG: sigma-70 family RNA polymerase sigma factor [Planctomycetota bacterium]